MYHHTTEFIIVSVHQYVIKNHESILMPAVLIQYQRVCDVPLLWLYCPFSASPSPAVSVSSPFTLFFVQTSLRGSNSVSQWPSCMYGCMEHSCWIKFLCLAVSPLGQSTVARSSRHITQNQITFIQENPMAAFLRGREGTGNTLRLWGTWVSLLLGILS